MRGGDVADEPTPTEYKELHRDVCELVKEGTELIRRDIGLLREDVHEHDKQAKDILNNTLNASADIREINRTLLDTTKIQQETALLLKQSELNRAEADKNAILREARIFSFTKWMIGAVLVIVAGALGIKFM